jgi:hypothetical protein
LPEIVHVEVEVTFRVAVMVAGDPDVPVDVTVIWPVYVPAANPEIEADS